MAQPRSYTQSTNFNDFSTTNPADPHSGSDLDTEFTEIKQNTDDLNTNIALIQRDDGKLKNEAVHKDAFDQDSLALIGLSGYTIKGSWTATTAYVVGDLVTNNDATYVATTAHTSASTFVSTNWILIANSAIETTGASVNTHSGNGVLTEFSTTFDYAAVTDIQVFVAGALVATNLYTVGTNKITFTSAPATGTNNIIIWGDSVVAQNAKAATLTYRDAASTSATASAASATASAADLVLTNADVVLTHADVVLTHADVVLAEADKVQTGLDRVATAADKVATNADVVLAEADKVQTGLDRIATAADKVATNADVVLTAADVVSAEADKVQTGLDRVATAADVVSTNADVVSSAASQLAARNSAAAIANSFDAFDDKYLGRMADSAASATATTTGTWTIGGSTVTVASNTGIAVGQLFISAGGVGVPTGANVLSIDGTAVVLSDVFTGSDATESCTFTGYGVYGTFNSGKDGPATDNDNGALAAGMLYFNTTDNEMRICDGTNWIAASAAGTASLQEYKFVTTSGQVSSKTYSGTADVGGSFSYTQSNIIVFLNGVQLKDTTDYAATNGTSIVLVAAPALSDELNIIAFKSFSVTNVEGTTIKSTGESGGTKFLREDGDGTSSWQTAGSPSIVDNGNATAMTIDTSEDVTYTGNIIMPTNKKVKQKGAFMQSSTHQALFLGG